MQESAIAGMNSLDAMLGWVTKRKGGRAVVGAAIEVHTVVYGRGRVHVCSLGLTAVACCREA